MSRNGQWINSRTSDSNGLMSRKIKLCVCAKVTRHIKNALFYTSTVDDGPVEGGHIKQIA